jgi:hypothetical protein
VPDDEQAKIAGVRDEANPGEDLIRLDHDLVGAVDPLDPRRTISERRIDVGPPQIGRFEHVRVRREHQGQHRHLLFLLIAGGTFGNRPIAVKASAVSDPCLAAVKVGLESIWAEPRRHANGWKRRILVIAARSSEGPFPIRFADLGHRAFETDGLLNSRPMFPQAV